METHEAEARLAEVIVMQRVGGAAHRIDCLFGVCSPGAQSRHRFAFEDILERLLRRETCESASESRPEDVHDDGVTKVELAPRLNVPSPPTKREAESGDEIFGAESSSESAAGFYPRAAGRMHRNCKRTGIRQSPAHQENYRLAQESLSPRERTPNMFPRGSRVHPTLSKHHNTEKRRRQRMRANAAVT
ncbi:hypothetical protein EYF80_021632 [Liparis tanakae]|uniref:Uncharacterized protein n=1 Tax=Liparis tanakae TaxID=230148 RepID=A0A4Z2HQN1_9TELE|nr:hypothetical protein EYF80_021632 [Liparis tanakae]